MRGLGRRRSPSRVPGGPAAGPSGGATESQRRTEYQRRGLGRRRSPSRGGTPKAPARDPLNQILVPALGTPMDGSIAKRVPSVAPVSVERKLGEGDEGDAAGVVRVVHAVCVEEAGCFELCARVAPEQWQRDAAALGESDDVDVVSRDVDGDAALEVLEAGSGRLRH